MRSVLGELDAIRSPCYPYAVFGVSDAALEIDAPDVEIIELGISTADAIGKQIESYAAARLCFDDRGLQLGNAGHPPQTVDVVVVGGGTTGLYAANRFQRRGITLDISGMVENGVIVNGEQHVEADIVVNCIGFEKNGLGSNTAHGRLL